MTGTLLLYANCQADEMQAFLQRAPSLQGSVGLERVFLGALHEFVALHGRDEAEARLRRVTVVWEQVSRASGEERALVRSLVPAEARWVRFPALTCSALWPFGTSDNRPDADGRFPYSDMLAIRIWREMGGREGRLDTLRDDTLFARYLELSMAKMPDLQRVLELDLAGWRQRDADADIPMAEFLLDGLRRSPLFYTAGRGSWGSTGEMLRRLVAATFDDSVVASEVAGMSAEYVGNDTLSMPIHPLVGERLGLRWHDEEALHNWWSYRLGFRDFVVRCIRLDDLR